MPATLKKQQATRAPTAGRMSGDARSTRDYGNRDRDTYRRGPAAPSQDKAADVGPGAAQMEFVRETLYS